MKKLHNMSKLHIIIKRVTYQHYKIAYQHSKVVCQHK